MSPVNRFCVIVQSSLVVWSCLVLSGCAMSSSQSMIDVGDHRQVFIDKRFIAESTGVQLLVHQPIKTGEATIAADQPWEHGIGAYASVLKDGDTYHMWYKASRGISYARSKDGIHWEKPILGLVDYKGSRENNIVIGYGAAGVKDGGHGPQVFVDPTAPADQKFRLVTRQSDPGYFADMYSSPDGIHWKFTHPNILKYHPLTKPNHLDSQNVIFWDDRINKYVAYMRRNMRADGSQGRSIVRSESATLDGFAEVQDAQVVITHDRLDAILDGVDVVDYYTSAAIKYPWAQDTYYMFPAAYFHYITGLLSEFEKEAPVNAGPLHTQFAASRDGITWQRYDRRPFVRLGFRGSFDSMGARMFYGMVPSVDGREIYLYYSGSDRLHGWGRDDSNNNALMTQAGLAPSGNKSMISRLVIRRDGFVSARFDYAGGEFTTPPLLFSGNKLVLNIDTSATGIAQVGILDVSGKPIDGFAVEQCDRIHTCNEIDRVVSWRRNSDVRSLAGKPIRLKFAVRDSDLYAFQFVP